MNQTTFSWYLKYQKHCSLKNFTFSLFDTNITQKNPVGRTTQKLPISCGDLAIDDDKLQKFGNIFHEIRI